MNSKTSFLEKRDLKKVENSHGIFHFHLIIWNKNTMVKIKKSNWAVKVISVIILFITTWILLKLSRTYFHHFYRGNFFKSKITLIFFHGNFSNSHGSMKIPWEFSKFPWKCALWMIISYTKSTYFFYEII